MAQVRLEIGGRHYDIACRDGEEARLKLLGRSVDARANDVIRALGRGHEGRELVQAALLLADELDELRARHAELVRVHDATAAAAERCAARLETLAGTLDRGGG